MPRIVNGQIINDNDPSSSSSSESSGNTGELLTKTCDVFGFRLQTYQLLIVGLLALFMFGYKGFMFLLIGLVGYNAFFKNTSSSSDSTSGGRRVSKTCFFFFLIYPISLYIYILTDLFF